HLRSADASRCTMRIDCGQLNPGGNPTGTRRMVSAYARIIRQGGACRLARRPRCGPPTHAMTSAHAWPSLTDNRPYFDPQRKGFLVESLDFLTICPDAKLVRQLL